MFGDKKGSDEFSLGETYLVDSPFDGEDYCEGKVVKISPSGKYVKLSYPDHDNDSEWKENDPEIILERLS